MELLTCSTCHQGKPAEDFYCNPSRKTGRNNTCKVCQCDRIRAYRRRERPECEMESILKTRRKAYARRKAAAMANPDTADRWIRANQVRTEKSKLKLVLVYPAWLRGGMPDETKLRKMGVVRSHQKSMDVEEWEDLGPLPYEREYQVSEIDDREYTLHLYR